MPVADTPGATVTDETIHRTEFLNVRVQAEQKAQYEEAARLERRRLSEYVRRVLDDASARRIARSGGGA